ncbi:XTP/dITP diphosphatase [Cohnella endophytica]|uniref:dITP/XTP pyrophosphatase n=1 Tax=Cohnella endophytica TaxID=2419778 RepID=A0A494XWG7_9BACL|nr:XTP/dITP diphosphatase [Cohnella endophytica]RKP54205.1 XTP/dITP diphosphatase [Cohnella endophytica]
MIKSGDTILLATRNRGKSKEFREAFGKLGILVKDLHDIEGIPDIEETGETFADNAFLKAKAVADIVGFAVLADDSGLCVDELNGAPGVYSARYAGEEANDANNNAKLLRELKRLEDAGELKGQADVTQLSAARFMCALVLYDPADESKLQAEGSVEGQILREAKGEGGFGYDPLFWLPERGKSMAELAPEEKNAISHRGNALRKLLTLIGE